MRNTLTKIFDYLDDQPWYQSTVWPIQRFWRNYGPRALYMEAKYFIQRGRRGYSDRDLWNLNDKIATEVLAFLDSERMGLAFWGGDFDKPFEEHKKNHQKTETELRWLMEQFIEDDWEKWKDPTHRKRVERANRLFGKYWMSLWD